MNNIYFFMLVNFVRNQRLDFCSFRYTLKMQKVIVLVYLSPKSFQYNGQLFLLPPFQVTFQLLTGYIIETTFYVPFSTLNLGQLFSNLKSTVMEQEQNYVQKQKKVEINYRARGGNTLIAFGSLTISIGILIAIPMLFHGLTMENFNGKGFIVFKRSLNILFISLSVGFICRGLGELINISRIQLALTECGLKQQGFEIAVSYNGIAIRMAEAKMSPKQEKNEDKEST